VGSFCRVIIKERRRGGITISPPFIFSGNVISLINIMTTLPRPQKESIIYEDEQLYACLARDSITEGHVVVVLKKEFPDLNFLPDRDYDYLMDTIFAVRNALLKTLKIKKVYLIYMDEANHVHWHLVPRYVTKGFDLFQHKLRVLKDFSLVKKIKENLIFK